MLPGNRAAAAGTASGIRWTMPRAGLQQRTPFRRCRAVEGGRRGGRTDSRGARGPQPRAGPHHRCAKRRSKTTNPTTIPCCWRCPRTMWPGWRCFPPAVQRAFPFAARAVSSPFGIVPDHPKQGMAASGCVPLAQGNSGLDKAAQVRAVSPILMRSRTERRHPRVSRQRPVLVEWRSFHGACRPVACGTLRACRPDILERHARRHARRCARSGFIRPAEPAFEACPTDSLPITR